MFVKLTEELKEELAIENDYVTWTELKEKLSNKTATGTGTDAATDSIGLLKGCKFMTKEPVKKTKTLVTSTEYAKLISHMNPNAAIRTEITQLRSDLLELRRESTWLLNCFLSIVGVSVFVYFAVSFYFEKVESRIVLALCSGLILFFIEVLLYIIRE